MNLHKFHLRSEGFDIVICSSALFTPACAGLAARPWIRPHLTLCPSYDNLIVATSYLLDDGARWAL
jgi:hypothetical protein